MKDALIKALRSASNAVAGNVAGPVDLISMGLRGVGVPVPQNAIGGSDWMRQRGLLSDVPMGPERIVGETLGLLGPTVIAQKAPQIARGLLQGAENLAAPSKLSKQAGAVINPSYGIAHRPMTTKGGAATLDDLTSSFGEDIYGPKALRIFGSGDPRERAVLQTLKKVRGNPDAMVTIYRGVPDNVSVINPGDWVTLSPQAAAEYGKVISMQVPAKYVTSWPDSLLEFGYYPITGPR